jgi:hypothetical protein
VLAVCVCQIVGLIIVDDLDIGEQAGAQIRTFDQGVRQQHVARKAGIQHLVQNACLIDTLAGEDAPTKDQLRNVLDDPGLVSVPYLTAGCVEKVLTKQRVLWYKLRLLQEPSDKSLAFIVDTKV